MIQPLAGGLAPLGVARGGAGNGLLSPALVDFWPLNEPGGANNAVGLHAGLTLTQQLSPGSAAGKVYAGARTFNGSTQYFSRASEAALQTGDVDFTIAAWVYPTAGRWTVPARTFRGWLVRSQEETRGRPKQTIE